MAVICALVSLPTSLAAQDAPPPSPELQRIRLGSYPAYTRIVLDLEAAVAFDHSLVKGPDRILIELKNARTGKEITARIYEIGDGIVQKINLHETDGGSLAVEIYPARMRHYNIQEIPNPSRLVVDVYGERLQTARLNPAPQDASPEPGTTPPSQPSKVIQDFAIRATVDTVVIDPGHGGKDPGAIGHTGLQEKDVVLDIATRLRRLLTEKLKKKVIMTRDSDVFIPLARRTEIANEQQADLFVSIHANASPRRSTNGIEVYLFGEASDRRAAETAARENASLEKEDSTLQAIMKSLSLDYKLNESIEFAHMTRQSFVDTLGRRYRFNDLGVKTAPFFVLVRANMPSILAEVSFITNPVEEKRLRSRTYRQKIAESLYEGIRDYISSSEVKS